MDSKNSKTRAVVLRSPGSPLAIEHLPLPEPGPASIVARVELAGLCGSDYYVKFRPEDFAREHAEYERQRGNKPFKQYVIGHEFLGLVEEVGPEVRPDVLGRTVRPGDRIAAHIFSLVKANPQAPYFTGCAAERLVLSDTPTIATVSPDVPAAAALLASCALRTVFHGLEDLGGAIPLGSTVVIQGAGSVGLVSAIIARESGAARVIVIGAPADRLQLAREFGADDVVDITVDGTPEARVARIESITGGAKADIVFECSGAGTAVSEAVAMLRTGGTALLIGRPRAPESIPTAAVVNKGLRLLGVLSSGPKHLAESVRLLERTHEKYPYEKILSHTFPLEAANEACEAARTGSAIKVALDPALRPA